MSDLRDAELEAQLAAKDARITGLEAQLAAKDARNSHNSNLPPSSDGPGGRASAEKTKPREGQRKRGGQPGHGGHKRELLPPEQVDRIVELYPKQCLPS